MYYYNARYYDPHLGSFITPDPAMDGLNHYAYANSNPIKYSDPTGLYTDYSDPSSPPTHHSSALPSSPNPPGNNNTGGGGGSDGGSNETRKQKAEQKYQNWLDKWVTNKSNIAKSHWQSHWDNKWQDKLGYRPYGTEKSSYKFGIGGGSYTPPYGASLNGYFYTQDKYKETGNYILSLGIDNINFNHTKTSIYAMGQILGIIGDCSGLGGIIFDSEINISVNVLQEVEKITNTYYVDSNGDRHLIDQVEGDKFNNNYFSGRYNVKVSELHTLESGYTHNINLIFRTVVGNNIQTIDISDKSYLDNAINDIDYTLTYGQINPNSNYKQLLAK